MGRRIQAYMVLIQIMVAWSMSQGVQKVLQEFECLSLKRAKLVPRFEHHIKRESQYI